MLFYRCLLTLALPVLVTLLLLRVLRGIERLSDFRERLGLWRAVPEGPLIWCHAASNGELSAARPIIESLGRDAPLLITCNSLSGKELALSWGLTKAEVRLAPIDLRWTQSWLVKRMAVQMFVLIEADFWPNRIAALARAGVQVALIGGRISKKSAAGWQRFGGLARPVFGAFDLICPQDAASADRLIRLGARKDAFGPAISLKALYQPVGAPQTDARHDIWLAASTHEGEDALLLKAHKHVLKTAPDMRMILAPRHPKRAAHIAQLARDLGLSVTQRSVGDDLGAQSHVYIADTLGEMDQWYTAAGICFVAGSLVPIGGHTPYEPHAHGCVLLHGPHLENFAEPYAALQAQGGAIVCETAEDIAVALVSLRDPQVYELQRQNAQNALSQGDALHSVLPALRLLLKN